MIEAMTKGDNWVLAQLCVDHLQPSKLAYVRKVDEEKPTVAQKLS
jgi:hypothetical protein